MRRHDREITEITEILSIIDHCKVIRIAMIDDSRPYLVPLNFGYSYEDGEFTFFCHGALEGRKIDVLRRNPTAFFEMDCNHELVSDALACGHSYRYSSIMGNATARFLEGDEKLSALGAIMRHQTGRDFEITAEQAQSVAVFALKAADLSAKARK